MFERKKLKDGSVEVTVEVTEAQNEVLNELSTEYNLPVETILSIVASYNLRLFKKEQDRAEVG